MIALVGKRVPLNGIRLVPLVRAPLLFPSRWKLTFPLASYVVLMLVPEKKDNGIRKTEKEVRSLIHEQSSHLR